MSQQRVVVSLLASLLVSIALVSMARAGEPVSAHCKSMGELYGDIARLRDRGVRAEEFLAEWVLYMREATHTTAVNTLDLVLLMNLTRRIYAHPERTPAQFQQQGEHACMAASKR